MAEIILTDVSQVISGLTCKAASVIKRGNLIGYSSGWVLADVNAAASGVYAQGIALNDADGNDAARAEFAMARIATIYDADAPFTANTPQYASGTAGALTETSPATAGDVIQVVGRSYDTYSAFIHIAPPRLWETFLSPDNLDTSSEPGLGTADAGWAGPQLTLVETMYFKGRLPHGLVDSVVTAKIILDSINASAGDIDTTIVAAYDGASNVEDTGTAITAGDWAQTDADNIILTVDISANFDAGLWLPGRSFCVYVDPDGITGAVNVIGLHLRGWVV